MSAITVCIPAYDKPELLREALDSLCDQGLPRGEMVVAVSDDASPRPVREAIAPYEERLLIEYRRNERNVGHIANYELAFGMACTPFVSFLPQDDLIAPGHLGRALLAAAAIPGTALVASLGLTQRHPGAPDTMLHGYGMLSARAAAACWSQPYVWERIEWMALATVITPLCMVGSVFRTEVFARCHEWKSFPMWHDRLMLAEAGLHGAVVTLPWIGGHYRVGPSQLSTALATGGADDFVPSTVAVLGLCERHGLPVVDYWIDQICAAEPARRIMYMQMLNRAMPPDVFGRVKEASEARLETRLHLGGRLDRLGIPRPIAEVLRSIDRLVARRLP